MDGAEPSSRPAAAAWPRESTRTRAGNSTTFQIARLNLSSARHLQPPTSSGSAVTTSRAGGAECSRGELGRYRKRLDRLVLRLTSALG